MFVLQPDQIRLILIGILVPFWLYLVIVDSLNKKRHSILILFSSFMSIFMLAHNHSKLNVFAILELFMIILIYLELKKGR